MLYKKRLLNIGNLFCLPKLCFYKRKEIGSMLKTQLFPEYRTSMILNYYYILLGSVSVSSKFISSANL